MSRIETVALWLVVLSLVAGILWSGRATWRECRRVHPAWYCFAHQ